MAAVPVEPEGEKREQPYRKWGVPTKVGDDENLLLLQYLIQNLLKTGFPLDDRIYESGIAQVDILNDLERLGFNRKSIKAAVELKDFHVNDTVYHLIDSTSFSIEKAKDVYDSLNRYNLHVLETEPRGNLLRNGQITCIYPDCKRSHHYHGFYHLMTQQQHLSRVHGWDRNRDILRGMVVDPDGNVKGVGGTVFAQMSELFENVDGFDGGQIDESGVVVDADGMRLCMVHFTDEGVKQQQLILGENTDRTGTEGSSQEQTANDEHEEQKQRMYMHYTISRDMTGSNDEVTAKLLAALGERSRGTTFKDLAEPEDDIAAKLLPALGGSGGQSRFKNADLTLLASKGRLR
jgi:hypothetical protein